jgi:hypothetical protein
MGHGYTRLNTRKVEGEAATGTKPRGWLGPGLTETWETPERR